MTGYDSELPKNYLFFFFEKQLTIIIDCLHFTVTSRKEMPNRQFVEEIEKAAANLHALHYEISNASKSRL